MTADALSEAVDEAAQQYRAGAGLERKLNDYWTALYFYQQLRQQPHRVWEGLLLMWHDQVGPCGLEAGSVYALACIPAKIFLASWNEMLPGLILSVKILEASAQVKAGKPKPSAMQLRSFMSVDCLVEQLSGSCLTIMLPVPYTQFRL